MNDFRPVMAQLKSLIGTLLDTLAKGADMGLNTKISLREWPKSQLKKLQWHFLEKEGVDTLIQQIHQQTQHIPSFYLAVNTELVRRCYEKLYLVPNSTSKQRLRALDSSMMSKLLSAGPEEGVSEKLVETAELRVNSALAHLKELTYKVMDNKTARAMPNLKADHALQTTITSWLSGLNSPRLCFQGTTSTQVSAIFYNVALEKRRAIVAFSSRHAEKGTMLSYEDRLFQMVYSILFQLLQQLPEDATFALPDMGSLFLDLQLSMESMPVALRYMKYFLDLVPQCIVLVDRFQYLSDGKNATVDAYLRDFLKLFDTAEGEYAYRDDGSRLLLSTSGKERIIYDMAKDNKMVICKVDGHVDRGPNSLATTLRRLEW